MLANLFNISFASAHVKAAYDGEYRRFLLKPVTYANLETTVKSLFNLDNTCLTLKFEDDEHDWVNITSDQELFHAVDLVSSPLRLSVQVVGAVTPVAQTVVPATLVQPEVIMPVPETVPETVLETVPDCTTVPETGCWKGKGKKERLEMKQLGISEKIVALEEKLNSQKLTTERESAIRAQISRLQERLEFVTACIENPTPQRKNTEDRQKPEGWARRGGGRGCRGRGGRDGCAKSRLNERLPPEILENFHQAKAAFQVAKEGGNPEEIEACKAAWMQAKQAKWAALDKLRDESGEEETKEMGTCRKVRK